MAHLAGAARPDRNRAIDFYRAAAMVAVTIGHWLAVSASVDSSGDLRAGNALGEAPQLAWATWLFQVMPLFFVVGGFASASSLDAHHREGGRDVDWVMGRLRRLLAPAATLAATWSILLGFGGLLGFGSLLAVGAAGAAIPLWFLANYTIDTAIAPWLLRRFRRAPRTVAAIGVGTFLLIEAIRLSGVPAIPQINWVLGWLLFQMAGFAWRDGLIASGRRLLGVTAIGWISAVGAVALGPWPVSMVHFPGLATSPTHPPSLALLLFGSAYSATAIAAAPAISRWLRDSPRAWTAVVAANSVAMTAYLWHMTAAVAAVGLFHLLGWLPTAPTATALWWVQKLPLLACSAAVLTAIASLVAPVERRELLAPRPSWAHGPVALGVVALAISVGVKLWAGGQPLAMAGGLAIVLGVRHGPLRRPRAGQRHR